jgi:DNA modification methylase
MARPMRNHKTNLVYEPFCGSGTAIIAAEQEGVRCFAVELNPGYVAVTIERYEETTGKKPVLLDG